MESLMTDSVAMDTLVRLAAIGTSGICVLAVFLIGVTLYKRKNASDQWHKSMRFFMGMCLLSATITGVTGIANAKFNAEKTQVAQTRNAELTTELGSTSAELVALQSSVKTVISSQQFRAINPQTESNEVRRAIEDLRQVQVRDIRGELDARRLEVRPITD